MSTPAPQSLTPHEQRVLGELKSIVYTLDHIATTLDYAVQITSPGGVFYEAQHKVATTLNELRGIFITSDGTIAAPSSGPSAMEL